MTKFLTRQVVLKIWHCYH